MGTRADFYMGRGVDAEWLGSICWDGYPKGITLTGKAVKYGHEHSDFPEGKHLFEATTKEEFHERLKQFFANREDVTLPKDGWPWPWEDSRTTDYAYAFDEEAVWASCFGYTWFKPEPGKDRPEVNEEDDVKTAIFPNMKDKQKVTSGKRSGLLVFGGPS